jgi:hypothetical protein
LSASQQTRRRLQQLPRAAQEPLPRQPQRLSLQREKLLVERKLAVNQTLPGIDGQLMGNQDAGYGKSPVLPAAMPNE